MFAPSLALAMLACQADEAPPSTEAPSDPPAPYIVPEGEAPEGAASLDEIEAALQEAVDAVLTVNAPPVQDAYDTAMESASPSCPYFYANENGQYWYDTCTSPDGTAFSGYVFAESIEDAVDPFSGYQFNSWSAFGGASVQQADGARLDLGGLAIWYAAEGPGGDFIYYSAVQGTFAWTGAGAAHTWMDRGLDPDIEVSLYAMPQLDVRQATVNGGFGGLGADGRWAASFDDVIHSNVSFGTSCAEEPHGTISVRAADGGWYDIVFHGPDDEGVTSGPCDGCGDVFYLGVPEGLACADFDALVGWEDTPW